jgi:hypothetical protein
VLDVHAQRYKNAEMFKYLLSLLTNTNEVETEIKATIIADGKCNHALDHTLKRGIYVTHTR